MQKGRNKMRKNWFLYIKINETDKYIISTGISFNDFINGIDVRPTNILVLKGCPIVCERSSELDLDYITQGQMEAFYQEKVYHYGDFCWIDFLDVRALQGISKEGLAQLLYLAHKKEPWNDVVIRDLENRYAYLSHDDDYWVKIYMENPRSYMNVVEQKIIVELKRHKKEIAIMSAEISEKLYEIFKQGAIIDFEKSAGKGVRIYPAIELENFDEMYRKLEKIRSQNRGICLEYNTISKQWSIDL